MKLKPEAPSKTPDISGLSATELRSVVEGLQQELVAKSAGIQQRDHTIQILEELLRWKRIQQFGASSSAPAVRSPHTRFICLTRRNWKLRSMFCAISCQRML
jgi:hypothetical protein